MFTDSFLTHSQSCLRMSAWLQQSPGILRLRSHWLPTLATDGALLFLVMLSFILPSPVTFTVKALPVHDNHLTRLVTNDKPAAVVGKPERCSVRTWDVLISELDVDDVISWFGGAVGDLTGAVLLVFSVDVHFARPLNRQAQATIACAEDKKHHI